MTNDIILRNAEAADRSFILALSPTLAKVAKLTWHTDSVVQKMQDDYIIQILDQKTEPRLTLIAQKSGQALGFIHVCAHQDEISGEACGTVPLLAVSPKAQGCGVGQLLVAAAQEWAKRQGYRLLHLEVFANNDKAQGFYQNLGFKPETLHMIKTL
ncbi:MAG: GNAT family N-acetyltransferase [Colwellia sp.]|nr:GNAT family N-acetyltransferase [Colwellia sp.]